MFLIEGVLMRQQFLQDACRYHRDNNHMDKLLLSLVVWWMPRWILEGMAASQVIQVNSISNGGKTKLNLLKELMKGRKDARGFKRTSKTDFNSTKTKLNLLKGLLYKKIEYIREAINVAQNSSTTEWYSVLSLFGDSMNFCQVVIIFPGRTGSKHSNSSFKKFCAQFGF